MAALVLTAAATALTGSLGITGLFASLIVGAATVAGAYLDRLLFTPSTTTQVQGPRLQSSTFMGSTEGSPIYRGYGIFKSGGQVIWATRFEEEVVTDTQSSGGKGGPTSTVETTTYNYYCSFAVGIAEGEIGNLYRVWADGKELIDLTRYTYRLYKGTETQNPDSLIETKEGDGNVPGYRGLAYIVFERMPLGRFGNRIPQLTFELDRPVIRDDDDGIESIVTAVDLIPSCGEFVYDPEIITQRYTDSEGNVTSEVVENAHLSNGLSNWDNAMDQMKAAVPNLTTVAFVVAWFGDDLRVGNCTVRPKVENDTKKTHPVSWTVSGINRSTALVLTQIAYTEDKDGPAYGGTPNDLSVYRAIQDLKTRGYNVLFYPFLLMDIASDNVLPNPYSANAATNGQPAFPWRGRITCSPAPGYTGTVDKTATAGTQVSTFLGSAAAGDFGSWNGSTIPYSGPNEWSYRRFILHYAKLCQAAGLDADDKFLIGSEMVNLTTVRSSASAYPFVSGLVTLAGNVQSVLTSAKIGYAANWDEYHSHRPSDGSNDVYFHLDPLWSSSNIDFIGIDNYMPVADWRDGLNHLDAQAGYQSIYDIDYLKANIRGGEYFDWYYLSSADRIAQVRTPITDGAYSKDWVFRNKDIQGWWENAHYNRPGGTEDVSPTSWTAEGKQIVFTEFGCPAIDKGANQPNVFFDPKSSESFVPYFSSGDRDDVGQRQYIRATIEFWTDNANNPTSGVYAAPMVEHNLYYWAFDARPWPSFPRDQVTWADKPNWKFGHWLNHRLGTVYVPDLLATLALEYGFTEFDFSRAYGSCDGYVLDNPMTFRDATEPLMSAFMFDLVESGLEVKATSRYELESVATLTLDDLLDEESGNSEIISITRSQETELPLAIRMQFIDIDKDYNQASVSAMREDSVVEAGSDVVIAAPLVIDFARAQQLVDRWLFSTWAQRETADFGLLPQFLKLEPGDVVTLDVYEFAQEIRLTSITDGKGRVISGRTFDRAALTAGAALDRTIPGDNDSIITAPIVVFMDLPLLNDSDAGHKPYVAAWSSPWPGVSIFRSATDSMYGLNTYVAAPATMGLTTSTFDSFDTPSWDDVNTLDVEIYSGTLSSITEDEVLNYANMAAVQNSDGDWEIFCFGTVELLGPNQYRLSHLLRGLRGTEHAMEDGLPVGSRFVILNLAIQQVNTNLPDINQAFYYRYGPASKPYTDPLYVTQQLTFEGTGLKPLSPVFVQRSPADEDGAPDVTIQWIRRSRLGGDLGWDAADIPLGEELEWYQVDILYSDDSVARTIDVYGPFGTDELPNVVYTAAEMAVDSIAVPFDVNVYQMSTTVGRGTPGRGTMADSAIIAIAAHGAKMTMFVKEEELTLSGPDDTTTLVFPDRAIILGVSSRVTQAITGATSFKVGISGELNKFGDTLGLTLGSTNMGVIGPTAVYSNTAVIVTANGSNFTGGKVRLSLHYILNEVSTS